MWLRIATNMSMREPRRILVHSLYIEPVFTPKPTKKPTPKPTKKPTPKPTKKPAGEVLYSGQEGEAVQALQIKLIENRFLYDPADGIYGSRTEKAVKRVQKMAGLPETGVADARTQNALNNMCAEFESQGKHAFMVYLVEYSKQEKMIHFYFENMGDREVTSFRIKVTERDGKKRANGDFLGNGEDYWLEYSIDCNAQDGSIRSGESRMDSIILYEGYDCRLTNGEVHTMRFHDSTKYACVCLMGYTTKDGKYHEVEGTNLYCAVR